MKHDFADYQTLIRHAAHRAEGRRKRAAPSSPAQRQPSAAAPRGRAAAVPVNSTTPWDLSCTII